MAYDFSKLTFDQLLELARKTDPNFGKYYDPRPKGVEYGSDEFYSNRQENTPKNFYNADLSSLGLGSGQYTASETGGEWTLNPNIGDDHNVQLRRGENGEILSSLNQANRGWFADHTKEIAALGAILMGGAAITGAGAGAGAGGGLMSGAGAGAGTSIGALSGAEVAAMGLPAGMSSGITTAEIAAAGGGIGAAGMPAVAGVGGGLLGGGTSISAMTPEAVWSGGLPASNAAVSGITPEMIAASGGGAGGVSGGLLGDSVDPYANETAKFNGQNAAQPGTLNPTNLPSVDTNSIDYLDYANKGMKAYNAISGLAGGGQQSGGGMANGTTTNQIDPRMAKYIYGDASNTGILDYAKKMYEANPQGMNAQMVTGMNNQWNTISDPRVKQGFDQIQNTGMGLLSMPIAGNPFTNGMNGKAQINAPSLSGLLPSSPDQSPFSLMALGKNLVPYSGATVPKFTGV